MIATPTGQNLPDFKQRYQGVCGWFQTDSGSKIPVYVYAVTSSKVVFRDKANNEYYANVDSGVVFEFIPTQRAFYNIPSGIILVTRVPARQWKRGICSDNTQFFYCVAGTLLTVDDWKATAFKVMAESIDYKTAVDAFVAKTREQAAISRHFAVTNQTLFFFDLSIGTVKGTIITVNPEYAMFKQELTDVIKRNNYPFKVE